MTVVVAPDGLRIDFGNHSTDEIKTLLLKRYPNLQRQQAGVMPVPGGLGAPSARSGPSPAPSLQPAPRTAPAATPGVPEGLRGDVEYRQATEEAARADVAQEGVTVPRTTGELHDFLRAKRRTAVEDAVWKAIPEWSAEKIIPKAYNAAVNAVFNAVGDDAASIALTFGSSPGQAERAGQSISEFVQFVPLALPEFAEQWGAKAAPEARTAARPEAPPSPEAKPVEAPPAEKPPAEAPSPPETWRAPPPQPPPGGLPRPPDSLPAVGQGPAGAGVPPPRPPPGGPPPITPPTPPSPPGAGPPPRPPPPEGAVRNMIGAMQGVFSPATRGRGEPVYGAFNTMAEDLRRELGFGARESATAQASLNPFLRKFNSLPPGWDAPRAAPGEHAFDPEAPRAARGGAYTQRDWADYVEGEPGAKAPPDKELRDAAVAWRKTSDKVKNEFSKLPKYALREWRQNYLTHYWKENSEINDEQVAVSSGKLGTGRYLKERSIPTISEGLERGWTPRFDNLFEGMYKYFEDMYRFLAKEKIIQNLKDTKQITWHMQGSRVPGKSPLKGVFNKVGMQGYIDANRALPYNNLVSTGFHGAQIGSSSLGPVYDAIHGAANASTRSVLAFSGYHALNVAVSAIADEAGRAVAQLATGHPIKAAGSLGKMFFAPLHYPFAGRKLLQQYTRISDYGPRMEKVADQASRANARIVDRNIDFSATSAGSFIKAAVDGSLSKQITNDARLLRNSPVAQAVPVVAKNFGRLADTMGAWLFDHYIPQLKRGALYHNMADWIDRHPTASPEEMDRATRAFVDSIDNRFGEMMRDNQFWHAFPRQIAQLAMLADGWQIGFFREFGGAVGDISKAAWFRDPKYLSTRVNYLLGFTLIMGMIGTAITYIYTGKRPQSIQDLAAPPTGGKNADGSPERLQIPGHSKDIFKWWEAIRDFSPTKMAKNFSDASNPLWAMIQETITRTNWKGQDINPTNDVQKTIWRTAQNLASHFIPITIQQYLQGHPKGSKFNIVTDIMGLRPARKAEGQPELSAVQEVQGRLSDARRTLASDKGIQRNYPTPSNAAKVKQDQQDIHEILQQLSKARQEYNKTKGPDKYVGTQIP